jgi:hypothetical protein
MLTKRSVQHWWEHTHDDLLERCNVIRGPNAYGSADATFHCYIDAFFAVGGSSPLRRM